MEATQNSKAFSNHKSLKDLFIQKELNMRKRRQSKLLKDYDFKFSYQPGKANVVANALSIKYLHISSLMVREFDLIEQFRDLSLVCEVILINMKLGMLKLTDNFLNGIRESQTLDVKLVDLRVLFNQVEVEFFLPSSDRRTDWGDYLVFGGFVESLCPRERRCLGWFLEVGYVCLK